jgi:hypothetical protein
VYEDVAIAFHLIPWQDVLATIGLVLAIVGIILAVYLGFGGKSVALTVFLVVVPLLVTLGWYGADAWERTKAGRMAVASVKSWKIVTEADFESGQAPPLGPPNEFGQGATYLKDGRLNVTFQSNRDATQEVPPASPIVGDFYAAADVKKVAGPTDAWCAVLFGYTGVEAWYALKIREHEWMLTQDVGTPDHNKLAGPNQDGAIGEITRVAIFVHNGETKFYLNNVEAGPVPGLRPPPGQVWLALQVPAQRSAVECAFDNLIVRVPS